MLHTKFAINLLRVQSTVYDSSAAWPRGIKRRFYGDYGIRSCDLSSTLTFGAHVIASLDKALYDDYLCLVASKKYKIQWYEVKEIIGKLGNGQLLNGCEFVQNITQPSLSRNRRIEMEQTNKL